MKVALIIERVTYGGGERVLQALARSFYKRGIDTFVYTRNNAVDNSVVPCKVICLDSSVNKIKQIMNFSKSLKDNKINSVIVFGFDSICFCATRLARVDYIFSLRIDPLQVNFRKPSYWYIIRNCEKYVFQTERVLHFFNHHIQKKARVIANPILDEQLPEIELRRRKRIVTASRLSEEKNIEMSLRAFAKIEKKGYTFSIYGSGPQEEYLKKKVKELHIEDSVIFEGQVERIIDHIKNAEIFVLTSNFEGMPNALIEGMAMGLACISTDFPTGAASEIIKNGESGFIIPMCDVDALADKLQRLIDDDILRKSFQEKAAVIRGTQSMITIIEKWIDFIEQ